MLKMTEQKLKGMDTSRIGTTSDDKRPKTERDKRLIVNQNRIEEIERIQKLNDLECKDKEETDEFYNLNRTPLCVMKEEVYNIQLSWGGGSDGFKLYFKDGELMRGVYYMADWGEYEESELTTEEAEEVYNFYMFGDKSSFD